MLSGEIDFVLKCVAPDLKTFQAFVAELTGAPHVRNVKTSLTLRNSKDAAMVPMELKAESEIAAATAAPRPAPCASCSARSPHEAARSAAAASGRVTVTKPTLRRRLGSTSGRTASLRPLNIENVSDGSAVTPRLASTSATAEAICSTS